MNTYLLALIGVVTMLIVGFFFYGLFFKSMVSDSSKPSVMQIIVSAIAMYIIALAFIIVYKNFSFATGVTGAVKGLYLGLLLGVPFLGLPLLVDGVHLKSKSSLLWLVVINWIVSLAIFGLIAGILI